MPPLEQTPGRTGLRRSILTSVCPEFLILAGGARIIFADQAKILVETITESPKENGYLPAIDINKMTIQFVSQRLDDIGSENIHITDSEAYTKINQAYDKIFGSIAKSNNNLVLKDIET